MTVLLVGDAVATVFFACGRYTRVVDA